MFLPVACIRRFFPLADQLFAVLHNNLRYSNQQSRDCLASFAHDWGPKLLPPRTAFAELDVLVIVPHYRLHSIPFHAIAVDDGYLGTAYALTYGSSATLLTRSASRNRCRQVDLSGWQYFTDGTAAVDAPPRPLHSISIGVDALGEKTPGYTELARLFGTYFAAEGSFVQPDYARHSLKYPPWSSTWDTICMVCHGYFEPDNSDYAGIMVSSGKGVPTPSAIALVPYMDIVLHQNAEHRGSPYCFSDFPFVIFPMESSLPEDQMPEVMTTAELKVGPPTNAELVALIGCHTGAGLGLATILPVLPISGSNSVRHPCSPAAGTMAALVPRELAGAATAKSRRGSAGIGPAVRGRADHDRQCSHMGNLQFAG